MYKYYDIGLNLFCKQFSNPKKIIQDAAEAGVCCILTGTNPRENKKIAAFLQDQQAYALPAFIPITPMPPQKKILQPSKGSLQKTQKS